MKKLIVFLNVTALFFNVLATPFPQNMVVSVPVADLLANYDKPNKDIKYPLFSKDILHKTQVIYGEQLQALEQQGLWFRVKTLEQEGFSTKWKPCEGWIRKDQTTPVSTFPTVNVGVKKAWSPIFKPARNPSKKLFSVSLGTTFHATLLPSHNDYLMVDLAGNKKGMIKKSDVYIHNETKQIDALQQTVVEYAKEFLNAPYCFGGRCAYDETSKEQVTSVDCSSLINLVYRAIGIKIPRCSHDQYLKSTHLMGKEVEPGDLIFFASDKPERINHVMIYLGNNELIEAAGTDPFKVRIISVLEKIGKPLGQIANGEKIGSKTYFFGSFLQDLTSEEIEKKVSVSTLLPKSLALFAPDDKPTIKLIELIQNASTCIHAAIYMITDKKIADELINAHNRGVDVKIITDEISSGTFGKTHLLAESGVSVYIFDTGEKKDDPKFFNNAALMHHKFMIVDNKIVWTGSFNWTVAANRKNQENIILSEDKNICAQYENHFIKMLSERCKLFVPNKQKPYDSSLKEQIAHILQSSQDDANLLSNLTQFIAEFQTQLTTPAT